MKLRKEIKYFLIGLTLSQGLTYSLSAINRHLERDIAILEVKASDYKVIQEQASNDAPCSTSSFKSYMDYRTITSEMSEQYSYIDTHMTIKNGYLINEQGYIGVALGSQFGVIGSKWVFELDTGNSIYAVKIEHKDDSDTINGCEHKIDKSVIVIDFLPSVNVLLSSCFFAISEILSKVASAAIFKLNSWGARWLYLNGGKDVVGFEAGFTPINNPKIDLFYWW